MDCDANGSIINAVRIIKILFMMKHFVYKPQNSFFHVLIGVTYVSNGVTYVTCTLSKKVL